MKIGDEEIISTKGMRPGDYIATKYDGGRKHWLISRVLVVVDEWEFAAASTETGFVWWFDLRLFGVPFVNGTQNHMRKVTKD